MVSCFFNNFVQLEADAAEKQQFSFTTIASASTTRTAIFALGGTARAVVVARRALLPVELVMLI